MTNHALTATTHATHRGSPISAAERIDSVDILRGFALLGILLINITAFKAPGGPPGFGVESSIVDRLGTLALLLFVESKFFTLFSFLFGLGFSIQLLRARRQPGMAFVPRFARRLAALSLFGILHVVLLWDGDILLLYSLVGCILLLFRDLTQAALLRWAATLLLIQIVLIAIGLGAIEVLRVSSQYGARLMQAEAEFVSGFVQARTFAVQLYGQDNFREILLARVAEYATVIPLLLSRVPSVLAMFLLGLYVGKRGILQHVDAHIVLLRRVRFWGLSLGLSVGLLIVIAQSQFSPISGLVVLLFNQALTGPIVSLGYAATLVLLLQRPQWQRRLSALAATGRMALTNYLMQSVLCTTIFYGYGLGLVGKVGIVTGILIAIGIYALQIAYSIWWLRRFRYGPLEWLWRSMTYLRWQPMQRVVPAEVSK